MTPEKSIGVLRWEAHYAEKKELEEKRNKRKRLVEAQAKMIEEVTEYRNRLTKVFEL